MNNKPWWYYLKTIFLVMRVIAFEKYVLLAAMSWWTFILILSYAVYGVHDGVLLAVVALGAALHGKTVDYLSTKKYLLIRKGDRVEYAVPDEKEAIQKFSVGRVRYRIRPADAANTSLFDPEHLDLYEHFYLIDIGKKNILIPYEWIISIETGELEL